jgi:hypothetical protein
MMSNGGRTFHSYHLPTMHVALLYMVLAVRYIKHFNAVVLPTQLHCSILIQYIQYHHDSDVRIEPIDTR